MADKEAAAPMEEKREAANSVSEVDEKGRETASHDGSEFDLVSYHEHNAGRLVVDPECALSLVVRLLVLE